MGLVCLDTLAVSLLSLLLSCVWRATLPRHSYVDILTLSVQHFDAQPALGVHGVSFLVFGTLTVPSSGSINASIALICEARVGCERLLRR